MDKSKLKQIGNYLGDLENNLDDKLDGYTYQDIISISQEHLPKLDKISDDLSIAMDEDWDEGQQYTDSIFLLQKRTRKCEQAIEGRINELIEARICELLSDDNIQTTNGLRKAIEEILTYRDFLLTKITSGRQWWMPDFLKTAYPRGINWYSPGQAIPESETYGDIVYIKAYLKAWDLKMSNKNLTDPPEKADTGYINNLQRVAVWSNEPAKVANAPRDTKEKTGATIKEQKEIEGDWSEESSKREMMARLHILSYYKFNQFAKRHGIKQIGDNRSLHIIRLDKMNPRDREKLEKK